MFWDGHIKEWNELPRANRDLNTIDEEDITDWMTQKFLHENVGLAKKHKKEQGQAPSANLNSTPQGQGSGSGSRKRCCSHDVVNKVKATILRTNKIRTRCRESSFKLMALAPIILMDIITGVNVI